MQNCIGAELVGYTDADWANDTTDRRSIGAFLFIRGAPISWNSKKQQVLATSTLEAEYTAFLNAGKEALWLRQLLSDIVNTPTPSNPKQLVPRLLSQVNDEKLADDTANPSFSDVTESYTFTLPLPTIIFSDSERAIQNVKTEGITARNKHFDIRLFKSKELQSLGIVDFTFVRSENNAADGLTKALVDVKHKVFQSVLGLRPRGG
jgi:hypothetical protein